MIKSEAAERRHEIKRKNWEPSDGPQELQLYNLDTDISESENVATEHPEVVEKLMTLAERAKANIGDDGIPGQNQRPAGWVEAAQPLRRD